MQAAAIFVLFIVIALAFVATTIATIAITEV